MNVAWWCSGTGEVWTWRYTPFLGVWILAATAIGGYVYSHRRAGVAIERSHLRRFCLGILALFIMTEWPLGQIGSGYLASVGIARYVIYTFVAAPLLLTALSTEFLAYWLPEGSRRQRFVATITYWPIALMLFNVVLFSTHLPVTIDTLKTTQLGSFTLDALHLSAAIIWWWPALRPAHERNTIQEPMRAFYLFGSSVLMFVPGAFLTFSPLPLYGVYELSPPLWLGFNPIADQQLAGIVMNVIGGFVLWGIIGTLFFRWAKEREAVDIAARRTRDAERIRLATAAPENPQDTSPIPEVDAGPAAR